MEVKNGIIIDGVLHEFTRHSTCEKCSLVKECKNYIRDTDLCDLFINVGVGIFVNRGKVKIFPVKDSTVMVSIP